MEFPRNWRKHRKLKEADNLELPVPRLEIRYSVYKGNLAGLYSLVYQHFLDDIMQIPLGMTMIGGGKSADPGYLELPFREGAHIQNEMVTLQLSGYVINGTKFRRIPLTKDDLPSKLSKKLGL